MTTELPPIGSVWQHTSGVLYAVFDHLNANEGQEGRPEYPPTIAYINALGRTYARRADDWARSFTRVPVTDDELVDTTLLAAMNHLMDVSIVIGRSEQEGEVWRCQQCGTTDQDGSGICVDCKQPTSHDD